MARTHHGEVAAVERRELRLSEALDDGKNCCVNEADAEVTVVSPHFEHAFAVIARELHDLEGLALNISKHAVEGVVDPFVCAPVVELHEDGTRYQAPLTCRSQQLETHSVVRIAAVERREQRPGV